MINYHADLVIKIDILLLAAYIIIAAALILYAILRDYRAKKRTQKLLSIKEDLARLFLSEDGAPAAAKFITKATLEEFIDVQTNRRKYTVFFNELEQQLFKERFVTAYRIKKLRSVVKKSGSKWRRIEAITALGYTQADEALSVLEESLYSKDEDLSYFSALAIGQISTMRSVRILMHFLKKRFPMRRKIASILETLSPDITDEVIKFADDKDTEVRVWAVRLLSRSAKKEYLKKVGELTKDESPDVRAAACESLAKLDDKGSKHLLLKCMKDDVWFVRMHAVRAISKLFGKESMPQIIELLNDGSLLVLNSVRQALVDNMDAALPYIHKILEGADRLAIKICEEAIEELRLKEADKPSK